ncbi:MAG: NAD-dependent epimerase/dehydratase family protein [Wenzhouxiangellaceae bacterium]|nr:NAD-dependent epimerase/dehydratase family protein [Wenzhouxiangellaceae bacterium]MBS3747377.1 NAD-dependent epimerase/dehydratase family protein [Wenzhouxiangellaceae bacterium]MBS3823886.1 NAD-dependent epimerase/dehydratase family protein [Wenzhouxiangellaceae bacterium]
MNVLVTGGGGFLGQAIVRRLLGRGEVVRVLNRSHYPELAALGVDCRAGDLADAEAVRSACRGCDAVVHVGARAGPGLYWPDFERANVAGTRNVLAACRAEGVGVLVHTSSPSVVHAGGDIAGGDESLPYALHFPAPYPATKAEAERRVLAADGAGLRTVALRPHLIWGPGDNHLLPRLIERNRAGRLRLPAPDKKIDTVYIDNAAEAHVLALDNLADSAGAAGKPYFVTNGEPLPVAAIMRSLLEAAGETPRIRQVSPRLAHAAAAVVETAWRGLRLKSDPPVSRFLVEHLSTAHWFDIGAAERDLGYRPAVSIAEGLRRLAAAWRREGGARR